MTLVRFKNNPAEAFRDSVMPIFNGLFNSIMNEAESNFKTQFFTPKADILETNESFNIHLSIPGIEKENVNIDLKNNTLTISGEKAVLKKLSSTHKCNLKQTSLKPPKALGKFESEVQSLDCLCQKNTHT